MDSPTRIGEKQNSVKHTKKGSHKRQKRAQKSTKPVVAVEDEEITYAMEKDPNHKGGLKPIPSGPGSVDEYDLDVIQLDDGKRRQKPLEKADKAERSEACRTFCQCGRLLAQCATVWTLVLLAMLARVLDLVQGILTGGVPAVILTGIQSVPPAAELLLRLVNGDPKRQKGNWSLNCPSTIKLVRPFGSSAPSDDPYEYFGGILPLGYKERPFWLPPQNKAVVIAPNCPNRIRNIILKEWPVSIPILCGSSARGQPAISLDGKALLAPDPEIERALDEWSSLIYSQLWYFFNWFRCKPRRWKKCFERSKEYRPTAEVGGRVYRAADDEAVILSLALSLFCSFLYFATNKMGWLTVAEAEQTFQEVWRAVLPESAKSEEKIVQDREAVTAAGFYAFLAGYLDQNHSLIVFKNARCTKDSVAALRSISSKDLLVLPRNLTLQALCRECPGLGVDTTQGNWEAALQRALLDAGVDLRTEGKDISWRYGFYPDGQVPKGGQAKLPCLGIPVDGLPDEVLALLHSVFGDGFGEVGGENSLEPVAEVESAGDEA